MNHMVGLLAVVLTLTAWGEVAQAQHPAKIPCLVFPFFGPRDQPHLESFHQGLRDLGCVDGKTFLSSTATPSGVRTDWRYLRPNSSRSILTLFLQLGLPPLAPFFRQVAEPLSGPSDLIRLPPVWVKSLPYPGGNVTGQSSSAGPEMMGKRLNLLEDACPKITKVAMLWNREAGQLAAQVLDGAKKGAKALGLQLRAYTVRSTGDIEGAANVLRQLQPDALVMPGPRRSR